MKPGPAQGRAGNFIRWLQAEYAYEHGQRYGRSGDTTSHVGDQGTSAGWFDHWGYYWRVQIHCCLLLRQAYGVS